MINKIINLLEENTSIRQLTCGEMLELIDRDSFYELAQEIEKLFAIPDVIKSLPLTGERLEILEKTYNRLLSEEPTKL